MNGCCPGNGAEGIKSLVISTNKSNIISIEDSLRGKVKSNVSTGTHRGILGKVPSNSDIHRDQGWASTFAHWDMFLSFRDTLLGLRKDPF